eukprot:CAMPEP_0184855478 /NCGR_PEP_ID=MMETSP0580-20130426/717_1 /TAXON_ID=1118495 /ORGANISM="Dactyliosolen fragilissimus" /LENGTH=386 /DNA_ID=CAMNT_0027350003 /DNA_START=284 /DNA_END=1444 /DNA_ORIENTATION=+
MAYNEDSSGSDHDAPWIQWFCGLKGHEMFCEVERSYIEDGFNLYGLRACVSNFSDCLDLILDRIGPDDSDDSHLTQSACTLYGLIHARYIITAHGLDAMYNKYAAKEFGMCPLVQCNGQPVLPVGTTDQMGADTAKSFCPKCQCVYHPTPLRSKNSYGANSAGSGAVDGAAFGTTFPHLFLMTFSNLVPDGLSPESAYVPRVFGFRVHQSAQQRIGCSGPGSAAFYGGNSSRKGGGQGQSSFATNAGSAGGGGQNRLVSNNAAGMDDAANGDNGTLPQDQTEVQDKTVSKPADSTYDSTHPQATPDENINKKQVKRQGSSSSSKLSRKSGNDIEIKAKGGGADDSMNASKRKTKLGGVGKIVKGEDNENGLSSKSKRQKRPGTGIS